MDSTNGAHLPTIVKRRPSQASEPAPEQAPPQPADAHVQYHSDGDEEQNPESITAPFQHEDEHQREEEDFLQREGEEGGEVASAEGHHHHLEQSTGKPQLDLEVIAAREQGSQVKPAKEKPSKKVARASKNTAAVTRHTTSFTHAGKKAPQKPLRKINLHNVEKVAPAPEGVTTPRSLRVCEEAGVNPAELAPRKNEDFTGKGVSDEIADIRFRSYDARRRARMAQLLPLYQIALAEDKANKLKEEREAGAANAQCDSLEGSDVDPEELERMRQMQRAAAQQEQTYSTPQHQSQSRRYSKHGAYSHSARATSPRTSAFYSISRSGGQSPMTPATAKIRSRCINENREPNEAERAMLTEIQEREMRRMEVVERAYMLEESRDLNRIDEQIAHYRHVAEKTTELAYEREKKQNELYLRREKRLAEAQRKRDEESQRRMSHLQYAL